MEKPEKCTELNSLACELAGILLSARAESTVNCYSGPVNKWNEWALKYGKCAIPADPFDVSLYLVHLSHSARSPAPITKAISAISWAHKLAGVKDPANCSTVTFTLEGLKRKLSKPIF